MRKFPRLGLSHIFLLLTALGILIFLLALLPIVMSVSSDITARQNTALLRDHGRIAGAQFASIISSEWQKLERLRDSVVQGEGRDLLRLRFDTARAMNEDCAWVGFADTSGKVVVSSGGILEGDSVLERPWFRSGIDGPFAGDKHEAVLLSRYLVPKNNDPIRLIDLAMPVKDKSGKLMGVIAVHIDWHWVRTFIGTFGAGQGVDLLLISRAGDIMVGPTPLEGTKLSLTSTLAAGQGVGYFESETWPDGQRYMVSVEPIQGT